MSRREKFSWSGMLRDPRQILGLAVAAGLLLVSLYPLYIMLRTSLQTVGDPFEGAPEEIVLARAADRDMTMQSRPMEPGRWTAEEGFLAAEEVWRLDDGIYTADLENAAFRFSWDGDLRRYRHIAVHGKGRWQIAWQDAAGNTARQKVNDSGGEISLLRPDSSLMATSPPGGDFDAKNISTFTLIFESPAASWERIRLIPKSVTLANYLDVWQADNFSRYTLNSFIISFLITFGSIVTSLCAGYAFARGELRGKTVFWAVMLGSMLIPVEVLLVPGFLILQHFPLFGGNNLWGQGGIGLLDSYPGLTLPNLVNPVGIFLVRQSLLSLPDSYEEAAVIDGASIRQVLWNVIAPLQRPILATVGLLSFLFSWNAFIFPLIIIQSPEMRTLPVGLALYSAKNTVDWVHLMAASAMTAIPIFALFVVFNRQLIAGLTHEGTKG